MKLYIVMLLLAPRSIVSFFKLPTRTTVAQFSIWSRRKVHSAENKGGAGAVPKTENQKIYQQYLKEPDTNIVICTGPAGSGKTALACHYAISHLKMGTFKKIVITRPVVTVEEEIGFLPGNLNKKMEPWTRPIMDIFQEYYSSSIIQNMLKENQIEISPLAFMRGRTFKDAIIIADEMQNSSPNQMIMLTTRIGDGSKIVITGDLKQSDTRNSGLNDLLYRYNNYASHISGLCDNMKLVEMNNDDIVRHPIVGKILDLYDMIAAPQQLPPSPPPNTPVAPPFQFSQEEVADVVMKEIDKKEAEIMEAAKQILSGASFVEIPRSSNDDCAMIPLDEENRLKAIEILKQRRMRGMDCDDDCDIDKKDRE